MTNHVLSSLPFRDCKKDDGDDDNDTVADASDNCPFAANLSQANLDGDAQGDVCDSDDDGAVDERAARDAHSSAGDRAGVDARVARGPGGVAPGRRAGERAVHEPG